MRLIICTVKLLRCFYIGEFYISLLLVLFRFGEINCSRLLAIPNIRSNPVVSSLNREKGSVREEILDHPLNECSCS